MTETILASTLGIWVVMHWGLYPLLLSSLVMAFLTMLRSPASVKLGSEMFQAYFEMEEIPIKSWRGALVVGAAILISAAVSYWLVTNWLLGLAGWALSWRAAVLTLFAANIGLMAVGAVAGVGLLAGVIAGVVAAVIAEIVAGIVAVAGAVVVLVVGVVAGVGVGGVAGEAAIVVFSMPGLAAGILLRAIFTRAIATSRHLGRGITQFPINWSVLVTSIDVRTEPEIVPSLPENFKLRFGNLLSEFKKNDDFFSRIITAPLILILFLPTWLFRLTLKSTFPIYWPLLFVSSAPKTRKNEDGSLSWDDGFGRSVKDWLAVIIATIALIAIGSTIYDPSLFSSFVAWADPRGLPAHALLRGISFKLWELDIWEWCALIASAITVGTFIWANAINHRQTRKGRSPSWAVRKIFYALRRLQTLCVLATILTSVFAWLWFVHDTCTLPDAITQSLSHLLGPPEACIASTTLIILE